MNVVSDRMTTVDKTCEVCNTAKVENLEHRYNYVVDNTWTCRGCDVRSGCTKSFVDNTQYTTSSICQYCQCERRCQC